jgi:drug/metabolite transporter (DMT)-like permease
VLYPALRTRPIAAALGALIFSEQVTAFDVVGIIVMLSGAYLAMGETPATKPTAFET